MQISFYSDSPVLSSGTFLLSVGSCDTTFGRIPTTFGSMLLVMALVLPLSGAVNVVLSSSVWDIAVYARSAFPSVRGDPYAASTRSDFARSPSHVIFECDVFPSELFARSIPSVLCLLMRRTEGKDEDGGNGVLFAFIRSLGSKCGNAASSSFGRAFCRCLGLMEIFSLVVLVGVNMEHFFSFDLSGFTTVGASACTPFTGPLCIVMGPMNTMYGLTYSCYCCLRGTGLCGSGPGRMVDSRLLRGFVSRCVGSRAVPRMLFA